MRNLQECQAEVFRRSEKRIQERKQRRTKLLTLCIPLALCITIFGAYLLPTEEPAQIPDKNQIQIVTENLLAGAGFHYAGGSIAIDGAPAEYGSVTVSGQGISLSYTSAEKVQDIILLIDTITNAPETTVTTGFFGAIVNTHETTVTTDEKWIASDTLADGDDFESFYAGCYIPRMKYGCIITVNHTSGTVDEYHLLGSMLSNLATGEVFHMTEVAHFTLKDALGLLFD